MDKKAKCSNRKCGWIGYESQMRNVVVETSPLKVTELHCPRCDGNSFYYKLKPDESEKPKSGAQLIALERARQKKIEGWTPEHDDAHEAEEMLQAAICYCAHAATYEINLSDVPWPWAQEWWKPSNPIRDLTKAGALIAAEIDRLQRKASVQNDKLSDRRENNP